MKLLRIDRYDSADRGFSHFFREYAAAEAGGGPSYDESQVAWADDYLEDVGDLPPRVIETLLKRAWPVWPVEYIVLSHAAEFGLDGELRQTLETRQKANELRLQMARRTPVAFDFLQAKEAS